MSDKIIYKIISDELNSNNTDPAIWTQAIAISEGDSEKTKASYIRLRYRELLQAASQKTSPATGYSPDSEISEKDNVELVRLRAELKRKLDITKKSSLYIALGLDADVSDSVIARTIADREASNSVASATSISEFNYAKKVLGDPVLREQYDRKLIEIANSEMTRRNNYINYEELPEAASRMSGNKGSVVVGMLSIALLGYLGLDFFKANNSHAIQKEVVDIQRDVADSATETDRSATDIALERQRQEFELRSRTLDQQRYEQDRRIEIEQEKLRLQREQTEERKLQQQQRAADLKVMQDKRYWACVNQQLSIPKVTTHSAYSRCGAYR